MSDFTNVADVGGVFSTIEEDEGVDFFPTGDFTSVVLLSGFGEGGFGVGPFGGVQTIVISIPETTWTDIETP